MREMLDVLAVHMDQFVPNLQDGVVCWTTCKLWDMMWVIHAD